MTEKELEGIDVPVFDQDTELLLLAELDLPSYLNQREKAAKKFGWPKGQLDKVVDDMKRQASNGDSNGPGERVIFPVREHWPHIVDTGELLDNLVGGVKRFIAMDDSAINAVALWVLFSHTLDAFEISPRIHITSPEKQCGKSTLLRVLSKTVKKPMLASNVSSAALFRFIDAEQPTVLLDEVDGFVKDNEAIRNLINAGHEIDACNVIRVVGDGVDMAPKVFRVWAPIVLSGIGSLQDTIESRSIIIRMRRRMGNEQVDKARRDNLKELDIIARQAERWATDNLDALKKQHPEIPDSLNDRAADNWTPLFVIADLAGGHWPKTARLAAITMAKEAAENDEATAGVMLLADCWQVFEQEHTDRISSQNLTASLIDLEGRPWCEWRGGKPVTQNSIARILKAFGIAPNQKRTSGNKFRGYDKSAFLEPYNRYVEADKYTENPSTPETKRDSGTNGQELPKTSTLQPGHFDEVSHLKNPNNAQNTAICPDVPLEKGGNGDLRENSDNSSPSNAWKDKV